VGKNRKTMQDYCSVITLILIEEFSFTGLTSKDMVPTSAGKTIQLGRRNPGGSYRASMITF